MKKKKKLLIVGNWKMYVSTMADAQVIARSISNRLKKYTNHTVVLCPAFLHIPLLSKGKRGPLLWGAQNVSAFDEGARTGEVGAGELADVGVSHVIVGHSERRALGETDADIARKVARARSYGIIPIVCIGESVRDTHGEYLRFIRDQLLGSLKGIPKKDLKHVVVAYEPVWAIGKKDTEAITPRDLHEMVIYIRKVLSDAFGVKEAQDVRVIYGGSVTSNNALSIVHEGEVSGLLIGRDSVKPDNLLAIVSLLS